MNFRKARAVNCTSSSFPSRIPTLTEPSGDAGTATGASVIDLCLTEGPMQNGCKLVAYGAGSDNDTFAMRVIGWQAIGKKPAAQLWIPVVLAELTCTLSAVIGVAGGLLITTDRLCDTLVIVTGNAGVSVDVVSPTGDVVAHAMVDLKGFQKLEICFDMVTATNGNCLVSLL